MNSFIRSRAARLASADAEPAAPAREDMVIYDSETSGTDARHDQILQFSGIRTDMRFAALDEPFDLRSRRLPYVVPAPQALTVTGTDAGALDDPDLMSEFELAGRVHGLLKAPADVERTFVTFAGLRFDDEFLRTLWFRNLLDPFPHPKRTTTRIDVYHLAKLAFTACPGKFSSAPEGAEGAWKLETLAQLNGIPIKAHDGLSDAEATRDLAKLIHDEARWAWDTARQCGNIPRVEALLRNAHRSGTTLWRFSPFDSTLKASLVIGALDSRVWLLFDLDRDPADIAPEKLDRTLDSWRAQGFETVKPGKMPLFVNEAEVCRFGGERDRTTYEERGRRLKDDAGKIADLLGRLPQTQQFERVAYPTSEERIYDGFTTDADRTRMKHFRAAKTWEERLSIGFDDFRVTDFACRILSMTAPQDPTPDQLASLVYVRNMAREAMSRPFRIDDVSWTTLMSGAADADRTWLEWATAAFATTDAPAFT